MSIFRRLRWQPKIYTAGDMREVDDARAALVESARHWRRLAEERQRAIDQALSFLRGTQYVGGPTEKEAWDHVWRLLGPFETEHQGVAASSTTSTRPTSPEGV